MLDILLEPFHYNYMQKAIFVSAAIGAVCAYLSAYLILRGWSLIGDALSHSVVPGVAVAYATGLPYAFGAFFAGILAALSMALIRHLTRLREDAVIGFIFSTFFALGLLIVSLNPTSISVQTIIFGNILGISDSDVIQVQIIVAITLSVLFILRKDLMLLFFDENHFRTLGHSPLLMKIVFFTLLSACTVAALQAVGAILVVAMVITPGVTAYLLTDRFHQMTAISVALGTFTCAIGAYVSYFLDGATNSIIVVFQTLIFLVVFIVAPKHGLLARRQRRNAQIASLEDAS